jgi:hypothetical protein
MTLRQQTEVERSEEAIVERQLAYQAIERLELRVQRLRTELASDSDPQTSENLSQALQRLRVTQQRLQALNAFVHQHDRARDSAKSPAIQSSRDPSKSAVHQARRAFVLVSALVPKRLSDEEIGDALEVISRMESEGRSRWLCRLKVVSAIFWVLVNAVREARQAWKGKDSA